MSTPLDAFNSRAKSAYIARLAAVRLKNSSSRSASANGASTPPFNHDDAHPGLPQPPRDGATDHARADNDGVSLFDRLGHLCWIRRSFFLSGLSAPLFSHAARVFKTAVGRVDLVIDHRIHRALDPFEDALLEIGQIIGRFFGQARP